MPSDPKVWLFGENNPYQNNAEDGQRYAMYPEPPESAGGRLCNLILGMTERDYLRAFERRNLLHQPKWSAPTAREAATALAAEAMKGEQAVLALLLGRKVWEAFFTPRLAHLAWMPLKKVGKPVGDGALLWCLALPHPSGLNRHWNDWRSYSEVRAAVAQSAPHLAPLLGKNPLTRGRVQAERELRHG